MDFTTGFFYLFSLVMLFAAFRVITARNPVHAVLFLILTFSQAAGVWLLLRAEFLALVLVLVYLGAVMVLFLFVVMMLDIRIERLQQSLWRHAPLALGMGALIAIEMGLVLFGGFRVEQAAETVQTVAPAAGHVAQYSNTRELGMLMYTEYLYPLEIAAVILLVAMIAAIALTLRERKDAKFVDPSEQVRVRAADRLQIIQMPATRMAQPAAPQDEESAEGAQP